MKIKKIMARKSFWDNQIILLRSGAGGYTTTDWRCGMAERVVIAGICRTKCEPRKVFDAYLELVFYFKAIE